MLTKFTHVLKDLLLLSTVFYYSHLTVLISGKKTLLEHIVEPWILLLCVTQLLLCDPHLFLQLADLIHSFHIHGASLLFSQFVLLDLSFRSSSLSTFLEHVVGDAFGHYMMITKTVTIYSSSIICIAYLVSQLTPWTPQPQLDPFQW